MFDSILGKTLFRISSFLVLPVILTVVLSTAAFAADKTKEDPDERLLSLDPNGVPLQIPVTVFKTFLQTLEDASNPEQPLEDVQYRNASGRVFFTLDSSERNRPVPYQYQVTLQLKNSELELPPIKTEELRSLFHRAKYGKGTFLAVETQSGLWAPATYEAFVVDNTVEVVKYYAGFTVNRLAVKELEGQWGFDTRPFSVPLAKVNERVFPAPAAFRVIPEKPENQAYYIEMGDEDPVAITVLGFQETTGEGGAKLRVAYFTPRRIIETEAPSPKVYKVPVGLLRTTYESHHRKLLAKARSQPIMPPDWLDTFEYPLVMKSKLRTFTEAYHTLRTALKNQISREKDNSPLFDGEPPCSSEVLAAAG